MKNNLKSIALAITTLISLLTNGLHAQTENAADRTAISFETDPSAFIFNGYAFHFRIKPKNSKHFLIGAGTYALDFPNLLVDMNEKNKQKGWKVRISSAYSLFGEYYFKEQNRKWFVGLQAGVQNFENKNEQVKGMVSRYSNLIMMPSLGYAWQPFKIPFYIKPWAGIGYTTKISGDNSLGNLTYDISPWVPFITVHIGYTIK